MNVDFTHALRDVSLDLLSGAGHYEGVVERMREARLSVWIATANLKDLHVAEPGLGKTRYRSVLEWLDELVALHGVRVRVLHARMPSSPFRKSFDELERLVEGGMELRQCPRVHLKTVIVDGAWAYIGSANWTGAGIGVRGENKRNFELGFTTEDERALDAVQALYDHIWRGASCGTCRLRDRCEAPLDG